MKRRLSRLQKIILEELASYRRSKTADVSGLSFAVAKRYAPEKMWRLEDVRPSYVENEQTRKFQGVWFSFWWRLFWRRLRRNRELKLNGRGLPA